MPEPEPADSPRTSRATYVVAGGRSSRSRCVLAAIGVDEKAGRLSDWQALVLGIVQGATELLPISSSGHLILVPWAADWTYLRAHESFNKTFDVALHLGTLIAVVVYFWSDIVRYVLAALRSLGRFRDRDPGRADRLGDPRRQRSRPGSPARSARASSRRSSASPGRSRSRSPCSACCSISPTGCPQQRHLDDVRVKSGFLIGVAQVLALMPGVSRSGITITAGRLWRLDRDAAARMSFLLLVPVVLGAVIYKGVKDVLFGSLPSGWGGPFLVGTLAALGRRPRGDPVPPRLRAQARLHDLRDLPGHPRGDRRDPDRHRRAAGDILIANSSH